MAHEDDHVDGSAFAGEDFALMTVKEACADARISPATFYRLVKNDLLKEKIRGDTTDQGRVPVRLDRRRWSAILAYLGLRALWEKYQNQAPARVPKDRDSFYRFAERAFEALEIEGIGGREHASVRSVLDALGELKKQGIILLPELA